MSSVIYRRTIAIVDKFVPNKLQPFWNSEAGPKTVFFWGAVVKAGLVAASLGDLSRPADQLSSTQSLSVGTTGVVWARWCLVIIPKNYPLFVVNTFVALTNFAQFGRAIHYEQTAGAKKEEQKEVVQPEKHAKVIEPLKVAL